MKRLLSLLIAGVVLTACPEETGTMRHPCNPDGSCNAPLLVCQRAYLFSVHSHMCLPRP